MTDTPNPIQRSSALMTVLQTETALPWKAVVLILGAGHALKHADEELLSAARTVQERAESVARRVLAGRQVNSLGELQGAVTDLDRLCVLRNSAAEHVRGTCSMIEDAELRDRALDFLLRGARA